MLIFFDTETTGVEANDRICAVGIVEMEGSHYELINPGRKIPPAASAIHQITNEMVRDFPVFADSQSCLRFRKLNEGSNVLISHNAPFDLAMLAKEGIEWQGEVIDTLKCAKALMDDLDGYGLQFLRYELRLYREEEPFFTHHGAITTPHHPLSDALHVKMLYNYLLDLAEHEKLVEISKSHVLLSRLPFGKYAKRRIEEIALKDPGYLKWMLESLVDMDEDLRYSIEHFLREVP